MDFYSRSYIQSTSDGHGRNLAFNHEIIVGSPAG